MIIHRAEDCGLEKKEETVIVSLIKGLNATPNNI